MTISSLFLSFSAKFSSISDPFSVHFKASLWSILMWKWAESDQRLLCSSAHLSIIIFPSSFLWEYLGKKETRSKARGRKFRDLDFSRGYELWLSVITHIISPWFLTLHIYFFIDHQVCYWQIFPSFLHSRIFPLSYDQTTIKMHSETFKVMTFFSGKNKNSSISNSLRFFVSITSSVHFWSRFCGKIEYRLCLLFP